MGEGGAFYTNQWAVEVRGGEDVARQLADDHGFEFIAKVRLRSFFCMYRLLLNFCIYCDGQKLFKLDTSSSAMAERPRDA